MKLRMESGEFTSSIKMIRRLRIRDVWYLDEILEALDETSLQLAVKVLEVEEDGLPEVTIKLQVVGVKKEGEE